jgi:TolA-binding protein
MMLFYIGNTYFVEKDYKNAAIEYMKGFKANPNGSKSAETLYKLALCFKQLNQKDKCRSTLKKIVDDYPGSFAQKAASELKKIK